LVFPPLLSSHPQFSGVKPLFIFFVLPFFFAQVLVLSLSRKSCVLGTLLFAYFEVFLAG